MQKPIGILPVVMALLYAVSVLVSSGSQARAQAASGDWELVRQPRDKLVGAVVSYDSGISAAVRCIDRKAFDVVLLGLPDLGGESRELFVGFRDEERHRQVWNVTSDARVVLSPLPAPFARDLREGGKLQVMVPGGGDEGQNIRYDIDLPASNAAVDAVLTDCGRPLVDPRDAELEAVGDDGLPGNVQWARPPRIRYPSTDFAKGFAVVTCLSGADGRPRDCVVETEHPYNGRFGQAALDGARNARLRSTEGPDAPLPLKRFVFTANFYLEGYEPRASRRARAPSGSLIRREPE